MRRVAELAMVDGEGHEGHGEESERLHATETHPHDHGSQKGRFAALSRAFAEATTNTPGHSSREFSPET